MEFEWDKQKAESNWQKHRVRFRDAVTVLLDEHPEEERYVTIGMSAIGQLLAVVYTYRGNSIRIISARKATKTKTAIYLE